MNKYFDYKGEQVKAVLYKYALGGNALRLVCKDGQSYGPSAYIQGISNNLKDDEIVIKNYSEHENAIDTLIANNIVLEKGRVIPIGYGHGFVCKLNMEAIEYAEN